MSRRLPAPVAIHYLRPPDRETVYHQTLVHDDGRVKVTVAADLDFDAPLVIGDEPALEGGSDAIWFTFPGGWHDIGRFHRADGTFTGIYANVITPCLFEPGGVWHTTDLFLDVWLPAGGKGARILDADELERAVREGALAAPLADRARDEARRIVEAVRDGRWPPAAVHEWTRERARALLGG